MMTFLMERTVPPTFQHDDPGMVALHARWAVDAYRKVGACWLGGVVTDNGMFSLVTAEREADLREYGRSLGIEEKDMRLRRVVQSLGPWLAIPQSRSPEPRLR